MNSLLFLIGYRGTGKTTVGQLLAARLGWDFVDADVHLEARHGKTIKQIFAEEGEPGFRDKETRNFRELIGRTKHVVATGGGIIVSDENRRMLRDAGFTIWLTASAPTIAQRVQADPTTTERRPNLLTGGFQEIESLLNVREPLYRQCADLVIDTEGRSPEAIVEAILTQWNSTGSASSSSSGPASAAC